MATRSRPRALALALSLSIGALVALTPAISASAAGTSYYVNSASASCSDSGSGTSTAAPWCSLTAASRTYIAGDQLLIANGSTYTAQQLTIDGQGTSAARISIGTYGTGAKPVLSGGTSSARAGKALVLLRNPSYVSVSGLALTSSGAGVLAQYRASFSGSATGNQSLQFSDLVVSQISGLGVGNINGGAADPTCHANSLDLWQSGGIAVTGDYAISVPSSSYFVSGVSVRNVEGHNNLNVVNIDTCDGQVGSPDSPNAARPQLVRNVSVDNVWAYDGDGAGYAGRCNEGMRFDGVTGLRIVNSRMSNLGACQVSGGTAGVILVAVTNATFANNVISDVPATGSPDMTGIDNELYVDGVSLRNNLIARNAGPAVEFLSLRCGISDYNTNHSITGNSFYGNADTFTRGDSCPSAATPFSGAIDRNLFGDSVVTTDPTVASWIAAGTANATTASGTVPHYAADEFEPLAGFAGWTYETTSTVASPSSWSAASFVDGNHVTGTWSGSTAGAGSVSAFEQTAGTCAACASARVWTAPSAGAISIRSLAFKSEAGGAATSVRIVKNGTVIAGPTAIAAANTTGSELNADLTVAAGDTIRFEVSGAGGADDWTSWAPSIAYVSSSVASTNGSVANGSFETPALAASSYQYAPTGSSWTFSPLTSTAGAGIARNGSAFGSAAAPDGSQVAFLQQQGTVTQRFSGLRPGVRYSVSLSIARRGSEVEPVDVLMDGTVLATVTPGSSAFTTFTTPSFTSGSGVHELTLRGTATTDQSAFVDAVSVVAGYDIGVNNASFESPALAAASYAYAPTGAGWSFTSSAGIAANGSPFGAPTPPLGSQVGLLQGQATISQSVPGFVSGQGYSLLVSGVQRGGSAQSLQVLVDGVVVGTVTPGSRWSDLATPRFTTTTGAHDVALRSTVSGDQTAFVDDVRIVAAASIAITNAGFESPALAANSFQYGPAAATWTMQPLLIHGAAGINRNGSAFLAPTATEGSQAAFVQRDGLFFSRVLLAGGSYAISFDATQRGTDAQQLRVEVDGVPLSIFVPPQGYARSTVFVTVPAGGGGQLEFVGTRGGTDNTALVDNIAVTRIG